MYLILNIACIILLLAAYLLFRYALDARFGYGFGSKFEDHSNDYTQFVNSQLKPDEQFEYTVCQITSFDGIKLKSLYIDHSGHNYIILCHGFANSPYEMLPRALHFYRMGYCCCFHPPGHILFLKEDIGGWNGWKEKIC